jgi:hypothetical protein
MEMTDNSERIVRTEFTMLAKAYIIPERFDNESTTKKHISTRATIVTLETDMSGKASADISTNDYNANKVLYDYLEINNSANQIVSVANTVTIPNVKIIQPPTQLDISDIDKTIKVYVNGVKLSSGYYSLIKNATSIQINFIGYPVDIGWEVHIAGKFLLV